MSAYLYDEQLTNKIKSWCKKSELQVYSPDETRRLFEVIADKNNDKPLELPIIAISRQGGYEIINSNKKPTTYDGITLLANKDESLQLNMVPINLSYQLDVYTRYYQEADVYMRNLIFNIINYPTMKIKVPSDQKDIVHFANIRILSDVENNSSVPDMNFHPGQFSRLTLQLNIDDAYLWDARLRDNVYIDDFEIDVKLIGE